jgi:hypothetical protein
MANHGQLNGMSFRHQRPRWTGQAGLNLAGWQRLTEFRGCQSTNHPSSRLLTQICYHFLSTWCTRRRDSAFKSAWRCRWSEGKSRSVQHGPDLFRNEIPFHFAIANPHLTPFTGLSRRFAFTATMPPPHCLHHLLSLCENLLSTRLQERGKNGIADIAASSNLADVRPNASSLRHFLTADCLHFSFSCLRCPDI